MPSDEIEAKIASFPSWHYEFDLKGHRTPIGGMGPNRNRQEQRARYIFDPLRRLFGGSLSGKRLLDLGSNAGYFSLQAVESGCDFVLGIDGRQMHVDQANFVFGVKNIDRSRYEFTQGDVDATDLSARGPFDIALCLGLLYHVSDPAALIGRISELSPEVLVIDTTLSPLPGRLLELHRESAADPRFALRDQFVSIPTRQAVIALVEAAGYSVSVLAPDFSSYDAAEDYRAGTRRAFFCARDPGVLEAIAQDAERASASRIALIGARGTLQRISQATRSRARHALRQWIPRQGDPGNGS
jgi:tRNA (mo5U34)-methyltransferase